jgi:tetratricopeptide (TPR) repeat protein
MSTAAATLTQIESSAVLSESSVSVVEDEFIGLSDLNTVKSEVFQHQARQVLSEIEELMRDNRWDDILAMFYPVESRLPELVEKGVDVEIRSRLGFVLGQVKRFDDALSELSVCVARDPESFSYHGSLAYTAYNSLYSAKNREIVLAGNLKKQRIELAHRHFQKAQLLRPDGVTNFYREGMLFKQLGGKPDRALPLFKTAVTHWESLNATQREERHQERKNYIKSLYQLASLLLDTGNAMESLRLLKTCLAEDEKSNHLSLLFKYFALGKVNYHLNQLADARDALLFALKCTNDANDDFVHELLARTYLGMDNLSRAWEIIDKVPLKARRPYYRWTEADILCAMKAFDKARTVLIQCQERDNRSRHKSLIRLVRIEYLSGNYQKASDYAEAAVRFFQEKWGKPLDDGLFWQSASQLRLGNLKEARTLAMSLKAQNPRHEKLGKLMAALEKSEKTVSGTS